MRESFEFLVVDPLIVFPDPVRNDVVQLAGEVERMTVREVATMGQVHAEHRVARLHRSEVHRHVGLCPRVRLHVRVLGSEQLLGSRDGKRLGDIDELAATVVASARVALRVLVRHDRTGRFEHRPAHEVLGCDELESVSLTMGFVRDRGGNLGIGIGE